MEFGGAFLFVADVKMWTNMNEYIYIYIYIYCHYTPKETSVYVYIHVVVCLKSAHAYKPNLETFIIYIYIYGGLYKHTYVFATMSDILIYIY